jgi:Na+/melibiose symporter-like transporter
VIFLPNTEEYPIGQLNPKGYINIAIVTSLICMVFGLLCSLLTIPKNEKKDMENNSYARFSFRAMFGAFLTPFRHDVLSCVIWGYVLTSTATVFLCGVGLHFFTYCFFYVSSQITILLLSLILGTILSQPLWVCISKKQKKKSALILGIMLTIVSVFAIIFVYLFRVDLYNVSFYLMIVLMFVCGIGSGALYCLPTAIYGDIASSMDGENNLGVLSGSLTFASNIANSITQLLIGVLLDVIKFDSEIEVQTLSVQTGIALILFLGVEISLIVSCLIFSRLKESKYMS